MWKPKIDHQAVPIYRAIVDKLTDDIRTGHLQAGERMPTMRDLAEALDVTVGTINRAYGLAERRGLLTKHVGRGTFVNTMQTDAAAITTLDSGIIDLSLNRPARIPLSLRPVLTEIARESEAMKILDYGPSQGQPQHRQILADWAKQRGVSADPRRLILTNGAQQALMVALGTLTRPGDTVLVEELTYPGVKNLARLFGLTLQGLRLDAEGIEPDAFSTACTQYNTRLLCCMPWVHNPTTRSMSAQRREQITAIAIQHGVTIIEEDVYAHGDEQLPALCELMPQQGIYIGSLSKIVAPGLRLGFMIAPAALVPDLVAVTQTTSLMVSSIIAELACRWIADGTAAEIASQRRQAGWALQNIANECLTDFTIEYDRNNTHLWLTLPSPWTGIDFSTKAAEHGVITTPAEQFAVGTNVKPAALRLCLGAPDSIDALRQGLSTIATLARSQPGPTEFRF